MAEDGGISVKGKTFGFVPVRNGFILKESHKQGKRELFLSKNQSNWIAEKLEDRSKAFGDYKRKESKNFNGKSVIMIEGGNQKGIFLSIQAKEKGRNCLYIIVPAGGKGRHWLRVAKMIKSSMAHQSLSMAINKEAVTEIQKLGSVRGCIPNEEFHILRRKIEMLESEVVNLKSQLVAADNPNARKEMEVSRTINLDQAFENLNSRIVAELHELFGKRPIEVHTKCIPAGLDPCSVSTQTSYPIVNDFSFNEHSGVLSPSEIPIHVENVESGKHESILPDGIGSVQVQLEEESSNVNEGSSIEETGIVQSPLETSNVNEGSSTEETDIPGVFWDSYDRSFSHSSGLRYDPNKNEYFTWVSDDVNDTRVLFFVFSKNTFILASRGVKGENNKMVLLEEGWDPGQIAESKKFPPSLKDLFVQATFNMSKSHM